MHACEVWCLVQASIWGGKGIVLSYDSLLGQALVLFAIKPGGCLLLMLTWIDEVQVWADWGPRFNCIIHEAVHIAGRRCYYSSLLDPLVVP